MNRAPRYKRKKNCEQYFKGFVPLKDIFFYTAQKNDEKMMATDRGCHQRLGQDYCRV
jgi:hypothetical protein